MKLSVRCILLTIVLIFNKSSTTQHNPQQHLKNNDEDRSTHNERLSDIISHVNTTTPNLEIIHDDMLSTWIATRRLTQPIEDRINKVLSKATTAECKNKIATHFALYLDALAYETSIPFLESHFENTCPEPIYNFDKLPRGTTIEDIMKRTYQPPRGTADAVYLEDPLQLRLLYGILTHEHPESTIRLIEALYEEGHLFVIHVDGKESSDDTYHAIVQYAHDKPYVHVLPDRLRCRVNWGGFSLVNATLQMLKYAFALHEDSPLDNPLLFHKFIHMSSTTYPIRSNYEIRRTIASYPLDANLVNVIMSPINPSRTMWHYYVECDDAIHRIYQLHPLSGAVNGADIFVSSQWFIISRMFAEYIAKAEKGTFVHNYLEYIEHVVVADESFFGTVLRNTEFCLKHHNFNLLHYSFDRWENEVDTAERDSRKCVHPDPDHCGRSPALITMDYFNVMDLSNDLFSRKFPDEKDSSIKNALDQKRKKEEEMLRAQIRSRSVPSINPSVDLSMEGQGVLFVARESLNTTMPLCMGLGSKSNKAKLVPCFYDAVIPTLTSDWETGAVIEEEVVPNNRWEIGPCSSDGMLSRIYNGTVIMKPGEISEKGPSCMLKQHGGLRNGRCLDVESERVEPGGVLQVYPCVYKWHQTFSFGNGTFAPIGAVHTSVPRHIVHSIMKQGKIQAAQLCLGVLCRSSLKPNIWDEDLRQDLDYIKSNEFVPKVARRCQGSSSKFHLHLWKFKNLVTVPCSDVDNVIDFVVVPFIKELIESEHSYGYVYEDLYDHDKNDETRSIDFDGNYVDESADTASQQHHLIYKDEL